MPLTYLESRRFNRRTLIPALCFHFDEAILGKMLFLSGCSMSGVCNKDHESRDKSVIMERWEKMKERKRKRKKKEFAFRFVLGPTKNTFEIPAVGVGGHSLQADPCHVVILSKSV